MLDGEGWTRNDFVSMAGLKGDVRNRDDGMGFATSAMVIRVALWVLVAPERYMRSSSRPRGQ